MTAAASPDLVLEIDPPPTPDLAYRQSRAARILVFGLAGGLLGDALFRAHGLGLNVTLYLLLLVGGVVQLTRLRRGSLPLAQLEPLLAATCFALAVSIRDDGLLTLENVVATLVSLGVAALWSTSAAPASIGRLAVGDVVRPALGLIPRVFGGGVGFLRTDASLVMAGRRRYLVLASSLGRALTLMLVVAASFAVLLAMGDAVFGKMLASFTDLDPKTIVQRAVFVFLFGWPVLGWLHLSTRDVRRSTGRRISLGSLDTTSVLAGMLLVFGLFLAVQVRILFGGQAYVQSVAGVSLAEYARSGFFVLVGVSAIVVGVLLALDWLSPEESLAATPRRRTMAQVLIGMVTLVLVSAVVRMRLYIDSFGFSSDRVHALVGMAWIAMALAAFAWTILRGQRDRFAGLTLRGAWLLLLGLNLANPGELIVRGNAARAAGGAAFDASYHAWLSADAVPALVRVLGDADTSENGWCQAAASLLGQYPTSVRDRRAWNLGHARAERAVERAAPALKALQCVASP